MRSILYFFTGSILLLLISGCGKPGSETDAYGNFTATEIMVAAEISGKVISKFAEEGVTADSAAILYVIDTLQNNLKRAELVARKKSVLAKKANLTAQIGVVEEQKNALVHDLERFRKMYEAGAASQKQIDDLSNNLTVLQKQIEQIRTNYASVEAEAMAMEASIAQVEDMISRAIVRAPIAGTIIETYSETGETVAPGKFLFKLADLQNMELKAYFSGDQLPLLKIGQDVEVLIDSGAGNLRTIKGNVSWISTNAEFTPKIIQTREERLSQVYAVKIHVKNDGAIKINMPGEVRINRTNK